MLIAGSLGVLSLASAAWSQLQPVTSTTFHSQQSSFYTTTTNFGVANATEILVNTDIQFPIRDYAAQSQPSNLLALIPLAFLLFMTTIALGIRSSREL